jgi:hypothetical protein
MIEVMIFAIVVQHVLSQIVTYDLEFWLPVIEWREDEQ